MNLRSNYPRLVDRCPGGHRRRTGPLGAGRRAPAVWGNYPRTRRPRPVHRPTHDRKPPCNPRLRSEKFILCTGGMARRLDLPGFDLTCTHSDAWSFLSAPPSLLVIGAGATRGAGRFDLQRLWVTSGALRGRTTHPHERRRRRCHGRQRGVARVGNPDPRRCRPTVEGFEPCPTGIRLIYTKNEIQDQIEATVAVVAAGWVANTAGVDLAAAGVENDLRGSCAG